MPPTRILRTKPDLNQLKRQAKELLRAFQEGDGTASTEVRAHFHGADPSTFALHDAQLVVARAHGFSSWAKLKAFVNGINVRELVNAVRAGHLGAVRAMLKARPELVNIDVAENNEHRALHYAVLERSAPMVRLLMECGADARKGIYPHRDATSAYTLAVERGYDDIVALIDEHETQRRVEHERKSGAQAAPAVPADLLRPEAWDNGTAEALLQANPALVHASTAAGVTPLHAAAATLNAPSVAWLLERGADPNRRATHGTRTFTPLDAAASGRGWGDDATLERFQAVAALLRNRGAELTERSAVALGETDWLRARHDASSLPDHVAGPETGGLLTTAVRHGRADALKLLLELGLDPDERHLVDGIEEPVLTAGGPLHLCAQTGRRDLAKMLLAHGANPNAEVYASGSVMYRALASRDAQMVELLEQHGGFADAATVGHLRLTEKARAMLDDESAGQLRPGSFNPVNGSLAEELLWAGLRGGDPEIVRMTLTRIDRAPGDEWWFGKLWSPLPQNDWREEAEWRRFVECFGEVLARTGPDVRHPWFGRTILHDLASYPDSNPDEIAAFASMLFAAGARTDIRDKLLKSSPLGWACRWGCLTMVKQLLAHGADPDETRAEPWATPRAWARKMKREDILVLLDAAQRA